MSAKQIERALGLPAASAIVLVRELEQIGILERNALDKSYHPSSRLADLGTWLVRDAAPAQLRPVAAAIAQSTGETTSVCGARGTRLRINHVVTGDRPGAILLAEGFGVPLPTSGVGLVLLSQFEDEKVERVLAACRAEHGRRAGLAGPRRRDLGRAMRQVRELGFLATYDLLIPGVGAVAVPAPGPSPGEPLALAVSGPTPRIRADEGTIVKTLRAALRGLGR
jgi:DNA-binding IclR family transcriptional regulator